MSSDSKQNKPNQEEIDLLYLFVKLGEFIKRVILAFIKFILSILVFLLQKWYYFVIAISLTIISALILNKISDPYFHSDMYLRSNATENQPVISILDRLGNYANSRNYNGLGKELDLTGEEASAIKGIQTYWIYDLGDDGIFDGLDIGGKFLSDTSITKIDSVFCLRAEVYDTGVLDILEESLVSYIENNTVLSALNKQRLSDLEAKLSQIDYEIDKLDSLQRREYFTNPDELRQQEGQIVFTSKNDVRMYHFQILSLLKLKQDCERDLNIYKNVVTVLDSFSEPVEPDNGIVQYAKRIIWFFLGLALLAAVVIKFRKKIWASHGNNLL